MTMMGVGYSPVRNAQASKLRFGFQYEDSSRQIHRDVSKIVRDELELHLKDVQWCFSSVTGHVRQETPEELMGKPLPVLGEILQGIDQALGALMAPDKVELFRRGAALAFLLERAREYTTVMLYKLEESRPDGQTLADNLKLLAGLKNVPLHEEQKPQYLRLLARAASNSSSGVQG